MRFLLIANILLSGITAKTTRVDLNQEIQEATYAQKLLHKKLLRILQNSEGTLIAQAEPKYVELQNFEAQLKTN